MRPVKTVGRITYCVGADVKLCSVSQSKSLTRSVQ